MTEPDLYRCRDCGTEDIPAGEIEHETCPHCGGKVRRQDAPDVHEPDPAELLADKLLGFARASLDRAEHADARESREWAQACRWALEARKVADEPLTEGERHAAAAALKELRRHLGAALGQTKATERQRDQLAAFMARMASEFESADTDQAKRQAARLRRAIADVMQDDGGEG
jgi:DNA-directed RNA polymerase subunit RPC12/RpoP